MSLEDFLSRLDPRIAKAVKTAAETTVEKLPLASYGITRDLGGGIARGRVCLLYGNTSSGKSLLMMQSIGEWQKRGLVCAYVDVEGTYDKNFAARLGVDNDQLILLHSKSSGKIERDIKPLLEAGIDVIVIDSISDVLPEVFIGKDGSMNDQEDRKQIGSQAKALTALMNGIHYLNDRTAVVMISQTTTFLGQTYVEQVPHGGQKVQFGSSQIIRLNSSASENSQIKGKEFVGDSVFEVPVARKVEYLIKKNKLGPPFRKGEYRLFYAGSGPLGVDVIHEVVQEAIKYDLVRKSGAWFSYRDLKWQGEAAVAEHFKDNPEDFEVLKKEIHTVETGEIV